MLPATQPEKHAIEKLWIALGEFPGQSLHLRRRMDAASEYKRENLAIISEEDGTAPEGGKPSRGNSETLERERRGMNV